MTTININWVEVAKVVGCLAFILVLAPLAANNLCRAYVNLRSFAEVLARVSAFGGPDPEEDPEQYQRNQAELNSFRDVARGALAAGIIELVVILGLALLAVR